MRSLDLPDIHRRHLENPHHLDGETDIHRRSHYSVNLIRQYAPNMIMGLELGKYVVDDRGVDSNSNNLQTSVKFTLSNEFQKEG